MLNNESYQEFTALEVWKKAREFKKEIWLLIQTFPTEEKFRLTDQIIRSSRSISATIAEGHGRFTFKDQIHFCIISRGSLSETYSHLIDAFDCNYIDRNTLLNFYLKIKEIKKILNGYIFYLRRNVIKDLRKLQ